eukprot:6707_1
MSVADEVPSISYTWNIPSLSSSQRFILCSGYCREINIKKLITPYCIIQLANKYFRPNDHDTLYRIKHASRNQKFSSHVFEMYQFKWMIYFYPNGHPDGKRGTVYLELHQVTPLTGGESVKVCVTLRILESLSVKAPRCVAYFTNGVSMSNAGWGPGLLKLDDLRRYKTITIRLESQLIIVTDDDCNDITDQILYETERKYEKKMRRKLVRSKLNPIRNDKGIEEVKRWLTNQVKLPEYFPQFIEHGVEDLFTMKLMTENDLHKIGVKSIGHKSKMVKHIQMLLDETNKK